MKIQVMAKCEKCGEIYDELGPLHLCADKRPKVEDQDTKRDDEHDNNSRGDWWGKDDNQGMLKEYCEGPVQPQLGSLNAGNPIWTEPWKFPTWADLEAAMAKRRSTSAYVPLRDLIEQARLNAGEVIKHKFINNEYVGGIGEAAIGGSQYAPEQLSSKHQYVKQVILTLRREDNSDFWIAPNGARVSTEILFDLGLIG